MRTQLDFRTPYAGPVHAVIFDWAGTTVDYGSLAPVAAFTELFRRHGVAVSDDEARVPMGAHKKDHIRQLLAMESVARRWKEAHGVEAGPEEVEALYSEFIPLQTEIITRHASLIPGAFEAVQSLKAIEIGIGSTTGYTREMMASLLAESKRQGYEPDCTVCADEVPAGRPAPWMALRAAMQLGVYPMAACVKVGDTLADIAEGLNAGMWTVAVTKTGNELGLAESDADALPRNELSARLEAAARRLLLAGAHYTIDDVSELPALIDSINDRLARGERP
ncbi:MAG: phosphonoacetaldehyde hydrolase [Bryobacteraceae bacterium]|jgi:phosphonoacetaldehyde hydrolase